MRTCDGPGGCGRRSLTAGPGCPWCGRQPGRALAVVEPRHMARRGGGWIARLVDRAWGWIDRLSDRLSPIGDLSPAVAR